MEDIPPPVIQLRDQDFDDLLNISRPDFKNKSVVMFYSPSCSHCHHMLPHFVQAAKQLDPSVKFGVCNIQENPQVMMRQRSPDSLYVIPGVPKMVSFADGNYYSTYSSRPGMNPQQASKYRKLEDIIDYINGIGSAEVYDE